MGLTTRQRATAAVVATRGEIVVQLRHLLYVVVTFVVSVALTLLTIGPDPPATVATLTLWAVLLGGLMTTDRLLTGGGGAFG